MTEISLQNPVQKWRKHFLTEYSCKRKVIQGDFRMAMLLGSGQKIAVLQVLLCEDLAALEIVDRVQELTKGRIRIASSGIYAMLHRMEGSGLIKGYYRTDGDLRRRRGHPRRYYEIRRAGRRVLDSFQVLGGMIAATD